LFFICFVLEAHKYFVEHIAKAYQALTDPIARENYEKYGHPDGRQVIKLKFRKNEQQLVAFFVCIRKIYSGLLPCILIFTGFFFFEAIVIVKSEWNLQNYKYAIVRNLQDYLQSAYQFLIVYMLVEYFIAGISNGYSSPAIPA
jgi:hypothetical protein